MLNLTPQTVTLKAADGKEITLETGKLARQADGSVLLRCGKAAILATVVATHEPKPGQSFFPLTPAQVDSFGALFHKMLAEQESDYAYKHELLFHYVMECIHGAMKLAPAAAEPHEATAATRLADSFRNLLARQFPIITRDHRLALRTPQAFADRLAVHVNYLSRTLKAVTGKTTSQLLAERLVQEARTLLLHTNWSIAQIGYCLGFEEPTRFTEFFRKHAHSTPTQMRRSTEPLLRPASASLVKNS